MDKKKKKNVSPEQRHKLAQTLSSESNRSCLSGCTVYGLTSILSDDYNLSSEPCTGHIYRDTQWPLYIIIFIMAVQAKDVAKSFRASRRTKTTTHNMAMVEEGG